MYINCFPAFGSHATPMMQGHDTSVPIIEIVLPLFPVFQGLFCGSATVSDPSTLLVEHQAKLSASPLPADYFSASVVTRPRQGQREHSVRVRHTASTETTTLFTLSKARQTSQGQREHSVRVRYTASTETTTLFISSEATTRSRKVNAYVPVYVHDTTLVTPKKNRDNGRQPTCGDIQSGRTPPALLGRATSRVVSPS
jgi:hypothetical protein